MTDLTFSGGNNAAGFFLFRCAPVTGLLSLPVPAPGGPMVVSDPPSFRSGFNWYTIYGTEGTKDYDEVQSEDDNGAVWAMKISLFLPGDSAEQRTALQQMVRHRFVLECQDNVGIWRRVGTTQQPLQLTYKFGIDGPMGGRRGAMLTFSGMLTEPPPLVSY